MNISRFDAFRVTVKSRPTEVRQALETLLGESLKEDPYAANNYAKQFSYHPVHGGSIFLREGGRAEFPNVEVKGQITPDSVVMLQSEFEGKLSASRADVCIDIDAGEGTFDRLHAMTRRFMNEPKYRRLDPNNTGDWERNERGRTFYLGSRKSEGFLRNYEKGIEQLTGLPEFSAWRDRISRSWTRIEGQFMPGKADRKQLLATMEADEVWGLSSWMSDYVRRITPIAPVCVPTYVPREDDFARHLTNLNRGYGKGLREQAARSSREEVIGALIERVFPEGWQEGR